MASISQKSVRQWEAYTKCNRALTFQNFFFVRPGHAQAPQRSTGANSQQQKWLHVLPWHTKNTRTLTFEIFVFLFLQNVTLVVAHPFQKEMVLEVSMGGKSWYPVSVMPRVQLRSFFFLIIFFSSLSLVLGIPYSVTPRVQLLSSNSQKQKRLGTPYLWCHASKKSQTNKSSCSALRVSHTNKYTRTLTFKNLRQVLLARVCGFRIQLRPIRRPGGGTFFPLWKVGSLVALRSEIYGGVDFWEFFFARRGSGC
jgi:hypothetical protein